MKIAAVTEDGNTISRHFGRAPLYKVLTVEDGKIVGEEMREKASHHTAGHQEHHEEHGSGPHGYDAHSRGTHATMAATIADCEVLLAGGMGWGAYESLKEMNIEPVITDVGSITAAAQAYLDGTLPNLLDRLH